MIRIDARSSSSCGVNPRISAEIDSFWSNDKSLHITMATECSLSFLSPLPINLLSWITLTACRHPRLQTFSFFFPLTPPFPIPLSLSLSLSAREEIVFFSPCYIWEIFKSEHSVIQTFKGSLCSWCFFFVCFFKKKKKTHKPLPVCSWNDNEKNL